MSSYLERFAASARNPSTRIAPLVRPLYLAPSIDPEPPGSSLERYDDEAVDGSVASANRPSSERNSPRLAPAAHSAPSALTPARPGFEPLVPQSPPPQVSAPSASSERDRPASPTRPGPNEMMPSGPGENADARRPAARPALVGRPAASDVQRARIPHRPEESNASLVPRAGSVQAPPRPVEPPPRPAHMPLRALAANQPDRRTPDEIQIHIGRVEVVALVPPQPPPATAPRERERRALRLDDYLRFGG